ncbi:uncharacterized protein [Panulirus ornatus]|uniref:uncharacterized protein n=1 Tax=Panulirus ornatus TaxID=150431 RepID=UPI003A865DCC
MSLHFSANQFESGYKASRLGNWEVGRVFAERPRQRRGPTRVIADDRGHLLPGVPRTHASPWGPLTQAIDPQVGERQRRQQTDHPRPATPDTDDDEDEDPGGGGEGAGLQVTGEGLLVPGARPEDALSPRDSDSRSGTITPASFRRNAKHNNVAVASVRNSRKSSAAGSRTPSAASTPGQERILKEAANLPADTVEDALLPRRPEEELTELTGSRALAIRLVDHPAPTNCTKYVVLRPNTAPSPAPSTKPPLLPKRPKTAKIIRKVPEIEFALKWDLKGSDIMEEREEDEDEAIEVVSLKKSKTREPPSPRSVSSVDSGVHVPKTAWNDGPDTRELASKLEHLEMNDNKATPSPSQKRSPEPESGYGTPKSRDSRASLPSVGSRTNSGRNSGIKLPLKPGSATPDSKNGSRRISIDSQRLAEESPKVTPKSRVASPSVGQRTPKSSRDSGRSAEARGSRKETVPASPRPATKKAAEPQLRDPLAIMETMDSVFHTVPLRDTGRGTHTARSVSAEKHQVVAATQTEEQASQATVKPSGDDQNNGGAAPPTEVRHNHPGHMKFQGPSDYKPAFKAGKVQHNSNANKPKYTRQSDRYNARLRSRHDPPRYWPINTLSSPFCNRPGYGQDQYPDHLRLRTTYGMAHTQAPKPVHGPLIKKLYL